LSVLDTPDRATGAGTAAPSQATAGATVSRRAWRTTYVRRIIAWDAICALLAGVVGHVFRFGPADGDVEVPTTSTWFLFLLPVVWVAAMVAARSYEKRFLWVGPEEFRRIFFAAALLLAAVGTVSWAFKLEVARGYVVIAIPLAAAFTLGQRWLHRDWLHRQRRRGRLGQTALLVGHRNGVASLHDQITRASQHGYHIVGCCLPGGAGGTFDGLPVLGGLTEVVDVVQRFEVDTVAVLPSPELEGAALRRLGWDLELTEAELLLAPATTEVAGPRVNIRPMFGLPLVHVDRPEFSGTRRIVKDVFDRTAAAMIILFLLPVLVTIAVAVKTTSRGPVFYRHQRVGRDGNAFHVLKFRSMRPGSDVDIDQLREQSDGNAVQFKMRQDPRVTSVGKVLRRYSLDELPQLINVLTGSMSLVGPRPHVTTEVEQYGFDMRRRLLVKPGITGLWQVSGRSDLSWDDSVRLDVRYVENWSLSMDLMILAKTVGAVVRGSGAY
jgi:exopolysaccharide biosynthesis polyprenyl glycosylphosphotransferase